MFHAVTFRVFAIAACGWFLASEAAALTLGHASGAALIGRPLQVAIPVTLDDAESGGPCAGGDVFYGDQKMQSGVSIRWEPTGGTQGVVHVSSGNPVDEPTVTVYLRIGCRQASTRRYVLLAEPPPDEASAPIVTRSAATTATTATSPPPARDSVPAARAAVPAARAPVAEAVTQAPRRVARAAEAPARKASRKEATRPVARLKLEPLDLAVERDPVLRLSPELTTQLAADPQRRQDAAALWATLQQGPEERIQEAQRLRALQGDVGALRQATQQNAAALARMRTEVEQARSQRSQATLLVALLAAVLAALLAAIGWRWYRASRVGRVERWFEAHGDSMQQPLAEAAPGPALSPRSVVAPPAASAATGAGEAGATAIRSTASPAPVLRNTGPVSTWAAPEEFQASRGGSIRMVGVEELIDVHDKADFFLSIGEHDQAIRVLESHVHDQVETSALAWMDLLELYHSLGKRSDYERLRGEFRRQFAVQVPDFEHFDQPTASLENYSRALSRIVALWPSRRVLDVIEESIFRKPGLPGAEPFSLEAYRELALLHHIAREVAPAEETEHRQGPATAFPDTSLQPLSAADRPDTSLGALRAEERTDMSLQRVDAAPRPQATLSDRDKLFVPPASARVGLDIDLDEDAPSERGARPALPPLDFDISGVDALDTEDPAGRA